MEYGYESNNNGDSGSNSDQRHRSRRDQGSSSSGSNNVNSSTGDFKVPMMVTGVLAYTPRERFLLERNEFLESKVKELEQHMLEIRSALDRQKWLDQRVFDLEAEVCSVFLVFLKFKILPFIATSVPLFWRI